MNFEKHDPSHTQQVAAVELFRRRSGCFHEVERIRIARVAAGYNVKCRACALTGEDGDVAVHVRPALPATQIADLRAEVAQLRDSVEGLETLLARARDTRDSAIAAHTRLVERLKGAAADSEDSTTRGARFIWESLKAGRPYEHHTHDDDGASRPMTCIAKVPDRPVVACQGDWMDDWE